ncbi:MAG: GntR family transcriptional regulator [Lachnospiraceae bacterium]|nr:GntR family transcriptional regulator [Lachnospiraceae bacterium]
MIVIDYRDKRPLYEQVAEKLAQLIICGALESNAKLPSVRSLAMELSINPNTIQRAYMQLEQDGYIYTVVGRGNYVTDAHEWQKGYRSLATKELQEALLKAKASGISLEETIAMAKICYESETSKGENTND